MSLAEIDALLNNGKLLIIFENGVYDISLFSKYHPGGALILSHMKGKDATDAMLAFHPDWVIQEKLIKYKCGIVADYTVSPVSLGYRALIKRINASELNQIHPWFWARELGKAVLLLTGMVVTLNWAIGANSFFFYRALSVKHSPT